MYYRSACDYDSGPLEQTKSNRKESRRNSYTFTKAEMIPIFQSGNTAVYDSISNMYLSKYAFMVSVQGGKVLFIEGEGYFPKSSTVTPASGNTLIVEKYTLCTVSSANVPPFTSNIIASTSFVTAGSQKGYIAEGTYKNQQDSSSLSIKANGDRVVTFTH